MVKIGRHNDELGGPGGPVDERAKWSAWVAAVLAPLVARRRLGPSEPGTVELLDATIVFVYGDMTLEGIAAAFDAASGPPRGAVVLLVRGRRPVTLLNRGLTPDVVTAALQLLADDAPDPLRGLCVEGAVRTLSAGLPVDLLRAAVTLADDLLGLGAQSDRASVAVVVVGGVYRRIEVRGIANIAVAAVRMFTAGGRVAKVLAPFGDGLVEVVAAAPGVSGNELHAFGGAVGADAY